MVDVVDFGDGGMADLAVSDEEEIGCEGDNGDVGAASLVEDGVGLVVVAGKGEVGREGRKFVSAGGHERFSLRNKWVGGRSRLTHVF